MIQNILIVCIGNICRSPMAEAFFAAKLQFISPAVSVNSAGLGALVGRSADSQVQTLLSMRGLDITNHRARQVTSDILLSSDLILTMDTEQCDQLRFQYPSTCGRVHRIGKWGDHEVMDPFKRPRSVLEHVMTLIDQSVDEWCNRLWS